MSTQGFKQFGDYTFRILENEAFDPLFRHYRPIVFEDALTFDVGRALSLQEHAATNRLREQLSTLFRLNIGIYHQHEFVGSAALNRGRDFEPKSKPEMLRYV